MPLFRRPHRESATSAYMDGSIMLPRYTNPPERNTEEWIKAYTTNPRLAVVSRIASDLSFAEGKLYRVDESGEEHELKRHPFLDFWENPNPLHEYTNAALWNLFEIYLKLKGEGYFVMERNPLGVPVELWPVPTHWVQMTPYIDHPFYTIRTASGLIMDVSVEDMFVMKDLNPLDPSRRGMGQAEPLADEIETDEYAAKFQKRFFFNDATPNIIIGMPKSTEDQRKRFRAEWLERFKGVFQSHGVATVNGEVTINKVGESMKDMDMVQGRIFLRDAALEHFGVPREIMGITESSNRATSEAAQFIYAQNVLMPNLKRREQAINRQLVPLFGPDLVWHFDDIIPRNQEFDKAVANDGWNSGYLTRNEAREKVGMPPVKNGDVYKTQFSDIYVGEDDDPVAVSAAAADLQFADDAPPMNADQSGSIEVVDEESLPGDKNALDSIESASNGLEVVVSKSLRGHERKNAQLQTAQRAISQAEREQSRKFEIATMKYFRTQGQLIENAMNGTEKAERSAWDILMAGIPGYNGLSEDSQAANATAWNALSDEGRASLVSGFTLGLIDWQAETTTLLNIFEPLWKESYNKGAGVSAQLYGLASIKRPELISTAKLRGGSRVVGITQTTKDAISRIVSAALEHGDGRESIAKQIQQEMQTSTSRARTIASQECNTSLLTGQYDMMRTAGAGYKTWHVTNPAVARPSHKAINGQTVPIDAKFSNGLMQPCDPNCDDASEVVNCHCFLTFSK